MKPERLIEKYSTIFIAAGEGIQVYHCLEEVPDPLREKLLETTRGSGAATILIADQRGREEIVRAAQAPRSDFDRRLAHLSGARAQAAARPSSSGRIRRIHLVWAAAAAGWLVWTVLAWLR